MIEIRETKPEPKYAEIDLKGDVISIFHYVDYRYLGGGKTNGVSFLLRIPSGALGDWDISMARDLLQIIYGVESSWFDLYNKYPHRTEEQKKEARRLAFHDYLIKIFEEKFGINIKICGFCKNYTAYSYCKGSCYFDKDDNYARIRCFGGTCQRWLVKKPSEEEK